MNQQSNKPWNEWSRVRDLLENGHIPFERKRKLLIEFNAVNQTESGAIPYIRQYGLVPARPEEALLTSDKELQKHFSIATRTAERAQHQTHQHQEAIKEDLHSLGTRQTQANKEYESWKRAAGTKQRPIGSGAGATQSDEILNIGERALHIFRKYLQLYHSIGSHTGIKRPSQGVGNFQDVRELYWQQSGIQFHKFEGAARNLYDAWIQLLDVRDGAMRQLDELWEKWCGATSEQAQEHFSTHLINTWDHRVNETVEAGFRHIILAIAWISYFCREKVHYVHQIESRVSQADKVTTSEWMATIELANGNTDHVLIRHVATIWGVRLECDLDVFNWGEGAKRKAIEVTRELASRVETEYVNFRKKCEVTKHSVDKTYLNLIDTMHKTPTRPFEVPEAGKHTR